MLTKTKIALATAVILGAASAAQANEPRDEYGGYKYGPYGQRMGTHSHWSTRRGFDFGFAFAPGHPRSWRHERDWRYRW
jgi:hypothetical protein